MCQGLKIKRNNFFLQCTIHVKGALQIFRVDVDSRVLRQFQLFLLPIGLSQISVQISFLTLKRTSVLQLRRLC
jgi:hypothetical protein